MRFKVFLNESITKERWSMLVASNPMLQAAVKVLKTINSHGCSAQIVGGAVRDMMLGQNSFHDVDICTNMKMEQVEKLFNCHDIGKNKDFGIVVVNMDGFDIEVAQYRTESGYSNNRHPDQVAFVNDFKSDSARRDFTINSKGIDASGRIHDHHGGLQDIKNKVIRTVGNPHERFAEDALRLLRSVRFASRLGFDIEDKTKKAIKFHSHTIHSVSPERIREELMKMAGEDGPKFARSIQLMDRVGLLKQILPEVKALQGFVQNLRHHPEGNNVFDHTIEALKTNKEKNPLVNLGILFHDLGKGSTYRYNDEKGHTFYSHAVAATAPIEAIAKRLKFTNDEKEALLFVATKHMQFYKVADMKPSKMMDLLKHKHFPILKSVSHADDSCRGSKWQPERWDNVLAKIAEIESQWVDNLKGKKTKFVDGNRVMELTGLKPSKEVGIIVNKVESWVIDNNIKDSSFIDAKIKKVFKGMK